MLGEAPIRPVCAGLDRVLETMQPGEVCRVQIDPPYTFGPEDAAALNLAPDCRLLAEVHVVDIIDESPAKATVDRMLAAGMRRRLHGNDLFQRSQGDVIGLQRALREYSNALACLEGIPNVHEKLDAKQRQQRQAGIRSCLLNRAATFLSFEQYRQAADDCTYVLGFDSNDTKALYRRGLALIELADPEGAVQDLELAKENISQDADRQPVVRALNRARAALRVQTEKEKQTYGKMFRSGPSSSLS